MAKAAAGEKVRPPMRLLYHIVAARYGTTAEAVREQWPADDFLDACNFLAVTHE